MQWYFEYYRITDNSRRIYTRIFFQKQFTCSSFGMKVALNYIYSNIIYIYIYARYIQSSHVQSVCSRFAAYAFIYRFFDKFDVHFSLANSIEISHVGFYKKSFWIYKKFFVSLIVFILHLSIASSIAKLWDQILYDNSIFTFIYFYVPIQDERKILCFCSVGYKFLFLVFPRRKIYTIYRKTYVRVFFFYSLNDADI